MVLTISIAGDSSANRLDEKTYTATVIDDTTGAAPTRPVTLTWSASHGSFVGGNTGASVVWRADVPGEDEENVTITCTASVAADSNPISSGPSLTALAEISVENILVNMFLTELGTVVANTNNIIYNASTGTLDSGSDTELSSDLDIFQLRWDNTVNEFVLNSTGAGHLANFFIGNTNQSVYLIFEGGTYVELTPTNFANAIGRGNFWARWQVPDSRIVALLNNLSTTSDLVVGVADAGSIGLPEATASNQVQVNIQQRQSPPVTTTVEGDIVVTLTAPTQAAEGATINIEATAVDPEGGAVSGSWRSSAGAIADSSAATTTLQLPDRLGLVVVSYEATNDQGTLTIAAAYITVGNPLENVFTPVVQIEVDGVDLTDRRVHRSPLRITSQLDAQKLTTFNAVSVTLEMDNSDGYFNYNNPDNFFLEHDLPAHGRGTKILVRHGESGGDLQPVFAGQLREVKTSLRHTRAQFIIQDLSFQLRQKTVRNFGLAITRRITDFDGVTNDYSDFDPVFAFPAWGLPISPGSVSAQITENGVTTDLNVLDTVATEGVLSDRNVEIDYNRGLLRFEKTPAEGLDSVITATWKVSYPYKRPDSLIAQLLKDSGINTALGISDDTVARFGVAQSLIRDEDKRSFTSHGRPHAEESGVVRWMLRDESGDTPMSYLIQDDRFIEYDDYQDEYTELGELPEESGLEGGVATGHGDYLSGESFEISANVSTFDSLAVTDNKIYVIYQLGHRSNTRIQVDVYNRDGTEATGEGGLLDASGSNTNYRIRPPYGGDIYNGQLYLLQQSLTGSVFNVVVYDLSTLTLLSIIETESPIGSSVNTWTLSITPTRIYIYRQHTDTLLVYDHNGDEQSSEHFLSPANLRTSALGGDFYTAEVQDNIVYLGNLLWVRAFTLAGVHVPERDFMYNEKLSNAWGAAIADSRHYILYKKSSTFGVEVYQIGDMLDFDRFVPYQFDTDDFDAFYFLSANNVRGNALATSSLDKVKVHEYVKSTNTWRELLNATTGQPQLSEAYKLGGALTHLANNRKNFQVVRHNNKTLIFYRRVQSGSSGIAYYNVTDNTITNVYTESHSGAEDFGLPYSMDFALDIRSDGIYVYTFVVRYTLESDGDFNAGSLKVIRRRVEPSAAQSQIYVENFTNSSDEEDYPVSVSSVMLADDRSKFYFVLDHHGEGDRVGKAELCTIAKAGGGSRTVIKTYNNPLLSARSPLRHGTDYYYLEGGWVRVPRDDSTQPNDQHHYPNEGGRLIEVESDNTVTDHGQVWRSATKLDSPDAEDDIYDGWGLHNAVISNLIADGRDNLHFVAGYGTPYNVNENLPFSSNRDPVPRLSNFHWIQWGHDFATKVPSFSAAAGARAWGLIEQLTQVMDYEIGFGPTVAVTAAIQAAHPSLSDWSVHASLFFRPRVIQPAKLRTALAASGTVGTIALNDSGLPAEISEFPVPPSGQRYPVIINSEMFTYTGVTPDAMGRVLTGVQRAQYESTAATHAVNAEVYFVDYFASGEFGATLVGIASRSLNFVNIRNSVSIGYGDRTHQITNETSIGVHGEFAFNLTGSLLSNNDLAWAELLASRYLNRLKDVKERLELALVFSPSLQAGQLLVLYQQDRLLLSHKVYRFIAVTHDFQGWQTTATVEEV